MKKFRNLPKLILILSLAIGIVFNNIGYVSGNTGSVTMRKTEIPPQNSSFPTPDAIPGHDTPILLRAGSIDTSRQPSLNQADIQPGLRVMGINSNDVAYYLVQFRGPIREEWKAAIEGAGGKLSGFVPNHAFIVGMDGATAEKVAALPEVKWIGLYQPGYKTAPRLTAETQDDSEPMLVTIMTFEPSAAEEVASAVEELGGQVLDWQPGSRWGLVRAEIVPVLIAEIARMVEVSWIEPYVAPKLTNDIARSADLMNVDIIHQTHGLTGTGQIIGHADSGLDVGDIAAIHPDFQGRIKAAYAWGRRAIADFDSPGSGPMGLAWDGMYLWNIDWSTDRLYKLTTAGEVISLVLGTKLPR